MARISVEQKALTDSRFTLLGSQIAAKPLGGYTLHALGLGAMLYVWNECQERGCHALRDSDVFAIGMQLGLSELDLAMAIEASGLGEWSRDRSKLRIKGTAGRTEWLEKARESNAERQRRYREKKAERNALLTTPSRGALAPPLAPPPTQEKTTTSRSLRSLRAPSVTADPSPLRNGEKVQALEENFGKLYGFYPRHVGKETAWRAFVKLDPDLDTLKVIAADLKRRVEDGEWTPNDPERVRFIPHMATYLNQRRWTDER